MSAFILIALLAFRIAFANEENDDDAVFRVRPFYTHLCPKECNCILVQMQEGGQRGTKTACELLDLNKPPSIIAGDGIVLDLRKNLIDEVSDTSFLYSKLRFLDLSENLISKLNSFQMMGMPELTHIVLNDNPITDIEIGAFEGLKDIKLIALQKTRLKTMPPLSIRLVRQLNTLDLTDTYIHCDCELVKQCRKHASYGHQFRLNCYTPEKLRDRDCLSLSDTDAGCKPGELDAYPVRDKRRKAKGFISKAIRRLVDDDDDLVRFDEDIYDGLRQENEDDREDDN